MYNFQTGTVWRPRRETHHTQRQPPQTPTTTQPNPEHTVPRRKARGQSLKTRLTSWTGLGRSPKPRRKGNPGRTPAGPSPTGTAQGTAGRTKKKRGPPRGGNPEQGGKWLTVHFPHKPGHHKGGTPHATTPVDVSGPPPPTPTQRAYMLGPQGLTLSGPGLASTAPNRAAEKSAPQRSEAPQSRERGTQGGERKKPPT